MISPKGIRNLVFRLGCPRRLEYEEIQEMLSSELKELIESGACCSITRETISEDNAEAFLLLCPKQGVPGEVLVHIQESLREWLKKKLTVPATTLAISDYIICTVQKLKKSDFKFTPISVNQLLSTPKSNAGEFGLLVTTNIVAVGLLGLAHSISPPKHGVEHICRVISVAAHGAVTSNNLQDPSRLLLRNTAVFLVVDCFLFFLCMGVNELNEYSQLK
jgi:hypothetical protein